MKLRLVGGTRVLHPEHPLCALPCPLCGVRLGTSRFTLVASHPGPGKHRLGGPWPLETALPVHEVCAEAAG